MTLTQEDKAEAQEIASKLTDYLNKFGNYEREEYLAELIAGAYPAGHPTMQQNAMRFAFRCIGRTAKLTYTDQRNEMAVKLARRIIEAHKDEAGLPLI
jgi:hypothetical protein